MFCNFRNSNFDKLGNRQISYQGHSLFSRLFFCKYFQSRFQEEFLIFDFIIQLTKGETSKSYFGIKWKLPSAFFSYYSFPFFLFAWTDSGRQNSICRGQQPNLYIPSSTLKTQINLASVLFLGTLEVPTFFAISLFKVYYVLFRVFFHIFDVQNSFCTYLYMKSGLTSR